MKTFGSYVMLLPERRENILLPLEVAQKLQGLPVHDEHGQKVGSIREVREGQNKGYWEAEVVITNPDFASRTGFAVADLNPLFDLRSVQFDLAVEEIALVSDADALHSARQQGDLDSIPGLEKEIEDHENRQKRLQQRLQTIKSDSMFKGGIIKMAAGKSTMYLSQKTLRAVTDRRCNPLAAQIFAQCCAEVVSLLGTAAKENADRNDHTNLHPADVARGLQAVLPRGVADSIIQDVFKGQVPDGLIKNLIAPKEGLAALMEGQ